MSLPPPPSLSLSLYLEWLLLRCPLTVLITLCLTDCSAPYHVIFSISTYSNFQCLRSLPRRTNIHPLPESCWWNSNDERDVPSHFTTTDDIFSMLPRGNSIRKRFISRTGWRNPWDGIDAISLARHYMFHPCRIPEEASSQDHRFALPPILRIMLPPPDSSLPVSRRRGTVRPVQTTRTTMISASQWPCTKRP